MPKVPVTCQECGKEFLIYKSKIQQGGGKYCSKECSYKAKSRLYSGENSPYWVERIIRKCRTCGKEIQINPSRAKENKGYYCSKSCYSQDVDPAFQRISKNCQFCGKEFSTKPTTHRPKGANYCSRECFLNGAGKNFSGKNRIKNVCPVCGKEFESFPMRVKKSEILYCGRECYAIDQSRRFSGKDHPRYKEKIIRKCQNCGKEFEEYEYRIKDNRGIYCSKRCQNIAFGESVKGDKNPLWRGGVSFEPYCPKFNNEFRSRVRTYFEYKCLLCGKSQKENGKKLCVHHVNYKKEACCDEDIPRYFVTLCVSCHAKTNNNREKYQKQFEKMIEKRFGGKSFFHKKEQLSHYGVI